MARKDPARKNLSLPGKKIKPEIAFGVILVLSVFFAGFAYVQSRQEYKMTFATPFQRPKAVVNQEQRILFDTNGTREAYKIQRDGKWIVVLDGQESAPFDSVSTPVFSPDGSQFAYSAVVAEQAFVVVNNVAKENFYDNIGGLAFSPDGQRLVYLAGKGGKFVVILNDKESKAYQEISTLNTSAGEAYFVFSQDGQNVAFKVTENDQTFIVVNGQEGKKYDSISNFVFVDNGNSYTYQAVIDGTQITVINQTEVVDNNNSDQNTDQNIVDDPSPDPTADSSASGQVIKYKKNKYDKNLDPDRLQYSPCSNSSSCNF